MGEDSISKRNLDSALESLLSGLELSPWVKVPATFVAKLAKRFKSLPADGQKGLADADDDTVAASLAEINDEKKSPSPGDLAAAIKWAATRDHVLDYWYGLTAPALNEIISRIDGARANVSETAPRRTQVAQLIDWLESEEGPAYSRLLEISSDF